MRKFIIINDRLDILESAADFKSALIQWFQMIEVLKSYADVTDLSPSMIKVEWVIPGMVETIRLTSVKDE
ncbi:MAG: hypothetical protein R3321_11630 [Nitrososphaeraceae archaeon]|nr:hypothetical protein [Nitrososphaeraceae archaeon]